MKPPPGCNEVAGRLYRCFFTDSFVIGAPFRKSGCANGILGNGVFFGYVVISGSWSRRTTALTSVLEVGLSEVSLRSTIAITPATLHHDQAKDIHIRPARAGRTPPAHSCGGMNSSPYLGAAGVVCPWGGESPVRPQRKCPLPPFCYGARAPHSEGKAWAKSRTNSAKQSPII